MEINNNEQKNTTNKLSLLNESIKKEIFLFKSEHSKEGYYFDIKLNEKQKKIKIFLTLLQNSEINIHNEDIDFIIVCGENYPEKEPKVFCITNVINNILIIIFSIFSIWIPLIFLI